MSEKKCVLFPHQVRKIHSERGTVIWFYPNKKKQPFYDQAIISTRLHPRCFTCFRANFYYIKKKGRCHRVFASYGKKVKTVFSLPCLTTRLLLGDQ